MSKQGGEGTFEELYAHSEEAFRELDYRKTLNILNKMMEISENDLQECWTRIGFATLSIIFEGEELDLTEARELADYALALSKKKENRKMELDVIGLISLIEEKCGTWQAYIENTEQMLLLSEELEEVYSICGSHLSLCKGYAMMHLFTKAKLHLDLGFSYVKSDPLLTFLHGMTTISYLLARGNDASAEELVSTKEEILEIANNLSSNDNVPFVVLDSQNIIQALEDEMGTSLFSIISSKPNAHEGERAENSKDGRNYRTRYKTDDEVWESTEPGALADAISRMDDVRERHPHLWSEKSKQERAKKWAPYRVDESVKQKQKTTFETNLRPVQRGPLPARVKRSKKKESDSGDWWFVVLITALISWVMGGMMWG
tara:strand:- start:345 stop:1466 length:1122 start_codon:yes stop_codon:yes gene_type:complete